MKSMRIGFAVLLLGSGFAASITCQPADTRYAKILKDEVLVEGVGFPGIITVYDSPERLKELFGKPRKNIYADNLLQYEGSAFSLTGGIVKEQLTNEYYLDMIIIADARNGAPRTKKGISLGDDPEKIKATYGQEYDESENGIRYLDQGILFSLSDDNKVDAICAFRIDRPTIPPWHLPQPGMPEFPETSIYGIELRIPDNWKIKKKDDEDSIAAFQCIEEKQTHNLTINVTRAAMTGPPGEEFSLDQWCGFLSLVMKKENALPEQDRKPPRGLLKRMNVNGARLSFGGNVSADAAYREYDMFLEKERYENGNQENYYYDILIESLIEADNQESVPDSQEMALISGILTSIKVLGPLLPTLVKCEIKGDKEEALVHKLEELVEASVFKEKEHLCLLLVNDDDESNNQWKEPLDPINKEHGETALAIAEKIRHIFKGKPYSITDLKIEEESEGIWHVLTVMTSEGEEVQFAFLPFKRTFLLGDID